MKKIVLFVFVLILAGCASATLPSGASVSDWKTALCSDAKDAVALGEVALVTAASTEQQTYWQRWIDGAQKGLSLGCGK